MQTEYDEIQIDYTPELKEDSTLEVAKDACFYYLEYNDVKYNKEEFEYLISFCYDKFNKINKLKSQMQIKKYSHLSFEIASTLDKITLGDSILETDKRNNYMLLTKDVNNILVQLRFCIGVLNKILEDFESVEI